MVKTAEQLSTIPIPTAELRDALRPETAGLPIDTVNAVLFADRGSSRSFHGRITHGRDAIAGKPKGSARRWLQTWQNHGVILGFGKEHLVYDVPDNASLVVGIRHNNFNTDEEAKNAMDVHHVFSTLFPYNFPRIHAVTGVPELARHRGEDNNYLCVNVRDKVEVVTDRSVPPLYPIAEVKRFLRTIDVPKYILFDWNVTNKHFGQDGGEYFLDMVQFPNHGHVLEPSKVEAWMHTHTTVDRNTQQTRPFTSIEHTSVQEALNRLAQGKRRPLYM